MFQCVILRTGEWSATSEKPRGEEASRCGVVVVWFGLVIPKAGAYEGQVVWRARGIASRRIASYRQPHPTRGHTEPHPHLTGLTALQPLNKWAEQPLLHLHSSVDLLHTPARLDTPDAHSGPFGSRVGNTEYHPQRSNAGWAKHAIPVIRLEESTVCPSTRTLCLDCPSFVPTKVHTLKYAYTRGEPSNGEQKAATRKLVKCSEPRPAALPQAGSPGRTGQGVHVACCMCRACGCAASQAIMIHGPPVLRIATACMLQPPAALATWPVDVMCLLRKNALG